MTVAIMQPTYLPWLGYFDLMAQADLFVFLDDAQFVRQSWHQRNRIKTPQGLRWLSVPVVSHGLLGQPINQVRIREPDFAAKHLQALDLNYRKAPFFDAIFDEFSLHFQNDEDDCGGQGQEAQLLVSLNLRCISWMAQQFGIQTPCLLSSELNVEGQRSARVVALCQHLRATRYLSPVGAAEYLLPDVQEFDELNIEIYFHNYEHPAYPQLFGSFEPYAAALDLLFNAADRAESILESGRRSSWSVSQMQSRQEAHTNSL